MMKKQALLYIVLLMGLAGGCTLAAPWKVSSSSCFTIHYQGDTQSAEKVQRSAERYWANIAQLVPEKKCPAVPIFIYPRRDHFLEAIGEGRESQIIGVTYSAGNTVRVDGSQLFSFLDPLIGHELTHVAVSQALGGRLSNLPLWFNEGLARQQEGGVTPNDRELLSDAVTNGALIRLSALSSKFPDDPRASALAYAEGGSVVEYLINRYGKDAIHGIIQKMQAGVSFPKAIRETTGSSLDEIERAWRDTLQQTHRWDWLETMYTPMISAIMVILCIVAWLVSKKRRNAILRRFEEEEFNDFLNR